MLRPVFICLLGCVLLVQAVSALEYDKVDKAIAFLKAACVARGEKVDIQAKGKVGLTIRHLKDAGISGEVTFSKTELEGFVDPLTEETAQQATKVRECMQPYVNRILDILLGSEAKRSEKAVCITFVSSREESKRRVLAEARKMAFSEFFGLLPSLKNQIHDISLDPSVFVSVPRMQGSPRYYNGNSFGEVCVKATFFITKNDKEQMQPKMLALKDYCMPLLQEGLSLANIMESYRFRSMRDGLSQINPMIKNVGRQVVSTLASDFKVDNQRLDFSGSSFCGSPGEY